MDDDTWGRIFTALKYRLLEYYEEDQTAGKEESAEADQEEGGKLDESDT